jgi:hypothetical protein
LANLKEEELKIFLTNKLAEREPFYSKAAVHLQGKDINLTRLKKIIKNA